MLTLLSVEQFFNRLNKTTKRCAEKSKFHPTAKAYKLQGGKSHE